MILSIGIDSVDIERCSHWIQYADTLLQKIFDQSEINYCKSVSMKSAERFGVRFAAKEAFFKALCSAYPTTLYRFFELARYVVIDKHPNGSPFIIRQKLTDFISPYYNVHLSVTHTACTAQAIVIIQNTSCR